MPQPADRASAHEPADPCARHPERKHAGCHDDKVIRITARRFEKDGQPWVRTTVEDHGNGIEEASHNRVFDPFHTTKPAGKGTGLGLCYGIVKEHGGAVNFETETGCGTRFHMDLPVKP